MRQLITPGITLLALLNVADASDRLVLQPPDKASRLVLSGDIADYTAAEIEIHSTVGKPVHRYPASQIITVQAIQTEAQRKGVTLFQHSELDLAQAEFEQALSAEPRKWVQREILGWLVKIAIRLGDRTRAGQRFLQITASESAPREYALIPLVWGTTPVDHRLKQQARLWLTGRTDVERLLGASVLLGDAQDAGTATAELNRLARVSDLRVSGLARCQLWRTRVTAPDVTENELRSWEATIARLPPELRNGPYYVLGRARFQRSEYDQAAAAFLWLPTVYRDNEELAALAAVEAAYAMQRAGRLAAAQPLLMEITTDYSWSPAAGEASALLAQIGAP